MFCLKNRKLYQEKVGIVNGEKYNLLDKYSRSTELILDESHIYFLGIHSLRNVLMTNFNFVLLSAVSLCNFPPHAISSSETYAKVVTQALGEVCMCPSHTTHLFQAGWMSACGWGVSARLLTVKGSQSGRGGDSPALHRSPCGVACSVQSRKGVEMYKGPGS